jgi:hypothetical protein
MKKQNLIKITTIGLILPFWALASFQEIEKKPPMAEMSVAENINKILYGFNVGIAVVFIFFILLLIASGIEFLVAGGDESSLDKAHKMWRTALLGMVSALIAYVIINLIKYFI